MSSQALLYRVWNPEKRRVGDVRSHKEISAGCMASPKYKEMGLSQVEFEELVDVGYLVLHDGKRIPIVSNAASSLWPRDHRKMPVVRGKIGTKSVDLLRDTGCSGVIVKRQYVMDDQYTVRVGLMQMVDNSVIRVPIANVEIDSPYLSGQVQALCPQDAVYDVIVGNFPGAKPADDPAVGGGTSGTKKGGRGRASSLSIAGKAIDLG